MQHLYSNVQPLYVVFLRIFGIVLLKTVCMLGNMVLFEILKNGKKLQRPVANGFPVYRDVVQDSCEQLQLSVCLNDKQLQP